MKLVELKINDFINEVDSKSPAPGGGSVAALSGSLSSSLARMVCHLTVGKKKFKALDETTQQLVFNAMNNLKKQKDLFTILIDKDTEAFNQIMAAFKLPKGSIEEKKHRSNKIEEATVVAIEVPKEVAETGRLVLDSLKVLYQYGNKNCLSDVGVSALLLHTTIIGAIMNMKINLSGISCENLKDQYKVFINDLYTFSTIEVLDFINKVYQKL